MQILKRQLSFKLRQLYFLISIFISFSSRFFFSQNHIVIHHSIFRLPICRVTLCYVSPSASIKSGILNELLKCWFRKTINSFWIEFGIQINIKWDNFHQYFSKICVLKTHKWFFDSTRINFGLFSQHFQNRKSKNPCSILINCNQTLYMIQTFMGRVVTITNI